MNEKKRKKALDEIFAKTLNPQSIQLLQSALADFVELEMGGVYEHVSDFIKHKIGVKISRMTIERFAKNEHPEKPNCGYPSTPNTQRHFADFLTRINIIGPEDLLLGRPQDAQLAMRLSEFFGSSDSILCEGYAGTYVFRDTNRVNASSVVEIDLAPVNGQSFLSAFERSFTSAKSMNIQSEGGGGVPIPKIFNGWGIFQSRDLLVLLLQNSRDRRRSKSYVALGTPKRIPSSNRVDSIFMLSNDKLAPASRSSVDTIYGHIDTSRLVSKILHFQRDDDFSRKFSTSVNIMNIEDHDSDEEKRKKRLRESKKKRFKKTLLLAAEELPQGSEQTTEREDMHDEFSNTNKKELGQKLFDASDNLDEERVRILVREGAPVNYIDPHTGCTPIFHLAVYERWDTVQFLLDTGECDLLIRNSDGRLLSTRVGEETGNMEWASKIRKIEVEQGKAKGILPRIRGDEPIASINEPGSGLE